MGRIEFRALWGHRVMIERKREKGSVIGTLAGEDGLFVFVEDATVVKGGQHFPSPFVAVHKKDIAMLRAMEEVRT